MSESVIVIGGGGHAKVVIDCILSAGDLVVGILDDALEVGTDVLGIPVLGKIDAWSEYKDRKFVVAIGNNEVRRAISERVNADFYTAIHPTATVSRFASVGAGSVVMPQSVINAGATVGNHCIINTAAVVEHDSVIGDFAHISPSAALAGNVRIGEVTHIGIGASIRNNITVCAGVTVGAGAAVVKNITEKGTYVGVPARRIK